jgi:hypothetical protein
MWPSHFLKWPISGVALHLEIISENLIAKPKKVERARAKFNADGRCVAQ